MHPLNPARTERRTGAPIASYTSACWMSGGKTRSNVKRSGLPAAAATDAASIALPAAALANADRCGSTVRLTEPGTVETHPT